VVGYEERDQFPITDWRAGKYMKIYITRDSEEMVVRVCIRAKSATRGDLLHLVYPDRAWKGWSYEALWNLGVGDHNIEVPRSARSLSEEKEQGPVEGLAE
jgi:hypothetical protein